MYSPLSSAGTTSVAMVSGTAYWVYVGFVPVATTVAFVEGFMPTLGTGTQAAEVCLASTPAAPNKASQTLTKIVASGSVTPMTSAGGGAANTVVANTSSFAQVISAGTHLWAGIRVAMGTTQPNFGGLLCDMGHGFVLKTAGASALTGSTSWTGSLAALGISPTTPFLTVTTV
jgi:hypothetical protein